MCLTAGVKVQAVQAALLVQYQQWFIQMCVAHLIQSNTPISIDFLIHLIRTSNTHSHTCNTCRASGLSNGLTRTEYGIHSQNGIRRNIVYLYCVNHNVLR